LVFSLGLTAGTFFSPAFFLAPQIVLLFRGENSNCCRIFPFFFFRSTWDVASPVGDGIVLKFAVGGSFFFLRDAFFHPSFFMFIGGDFLFLRWFD